MISPETEGERIEKSVTHVCRAGQHEGNGTGRAANIRKMKINQFKYRRNTDMKEKTKWNDYDALPLILDVTDIQHIMGISSSAQWQAD